MDKKLQWFIDKNVIFYPLQNEQILQSEELCYRDNDILEPADPKVNSEKTCRPHLESHYWIRDEEHSIESYREFVEAQMKLIRRRFGYFLSLAKDI